MIERVLMLAAAVALISIGIATIYAAGNPSQSPENQYSLSWKKQTLFGVAGIICFIAVNLVSYKKLGRASYWLYLLTLILLGILLLDKVVNLAWFVPVRNNSRRWIQPFPGVDVLIQPSELCKVTYILALGWYLRYRSNFKRFEGLVGPFVLTLLAMVLILLEPDLGTVLLMLPVLFSMLFVAGARIKHLGIIVLLAVLASPIMWHFMADYQKARISSVLLQYDYIKTAANKHPFFVKILAGSPQNLDKWQRNQGWHTLHSRYAIASGGLCGYGFAKGPYVKYPDLPERHNDFIFALIAHQWGFLGASAVILLYAVIIACGAEIAWQNTNPFARLTAVGIVAMFAVQVIVNISMTLGLMPITGLTLPLVSYGGSSLIMSMISIGILNNIGRTRPFSVAHRPFE